MELSQTRRRLGVLVDELAPHGLAQTQLLPQVLPNLGRLCRLGQKMFVRLPQGTLPGGAHQRQKVAVDLDQMLVQIELDHDVGAIKRGMEGGGHWHVWSIPWFRTRAPTDDRAKAIRRF